MEADLKFGGLSIAYDSGAKDSQKVLIMIHGFNFHSGIFTRLLPLAKENDCRIVLVNRRGYPGAVPYSERDWELIHHAQLDNQDGAAATSRFMFDRGKEVYNFLADFIKAAQPPLRESSIILASWSFTAAWMISLLANVSLFPAHGVDVPYYLRRVTTYDATYYTMGMDYSPISYNPLYDESVPPEKRGANFLHWISGYFQHPDIENLRFEERTPLADPSPTLTRLTVEQLTQFSNFTAVGPDGQDTMILAPSLKHDSLRRMTCDALEAKSWGDVEWRYIWCDMSLCDMACGFVCIRDVIAKAQAEGRLGRKINLTRWKGANHFAHWDNPGLTLTGLIIDDSKDVDFS